LLADNRRPSRLCSGEGSSDRGSRGDMKRSSPPAFRATAREEGYARNRMRSSEVDGVLGRREGGYKGDNPKSCPTPQRKSEEAIVAVTARKAELARAKGLYLSHATNGGRTA
jgi:hypothetical protein